MFFKAKNTEPDMPKPNIQIDTMIRLFGCLLFAFSAFGQANTGELRLLITDPSGSPLQASAGLISEVNQYNRPFKADADGHITAKRLPFGLYTVTVTNAGFSPSKALVEIRSALPKELKITLSLAAVKTTVDVSTDQTLIDPYSTSSTNRIGSETIASRASAQPGRGLADLVDQEPGWMFEANGILHPRGEEYQVQYVVDGMPLTENRSTAYIADFDPANVQEMMKWRPVFRLSMAAKWAESSKSKPLAISDLVSTARQFLGRQLRYVQWFPGRPIRLRVQHSHSQCRRRVNRSFPGSASHPEL